jgi:hypothetical protein
MKHPVTTPTTDDIGVAIHDAMILIDSIDLTTHGEPGDTADFMIDYGEELDKSNLRLIAGNATFRISIVREG